MPLWWRLIVAEGVRLRRSPTMRVVWLFPFLYLLVELLFFTRPVVKLSALSLEQKTIYEFLHVRILGTLWAGFFHPLILAILPALLFRAEHVHKTKKHMYTLPVPRIGYFLVKSFWLVLLLLGVMLLLGGGLWFERTLVAMMNPALAEVSFHGRLLARQLLWMGVGSLPLMSLYLWVSSRIQTTVVPALLGVVGLLLTITLSGADVSEAWQRDLNPWLTPLVCSTYAIKGEVPNVKVVHAVAQPFQEEPDVLRLPNGKKYKTRQNIPDEQLFPPPPPTPLGTLGWFCFGLWTLLTMVGCLDAAKARFD